MSAGGEHSRRTGLGHGDGPDFFDVLAQGISELSNAPDPQVGVGRPIGGVKRARAASIADSMSPPSASAAVPRTSSVAGLTVWNAPPHRG